MDYQSLKRLVLYHDKLYYDIGAPVLEDSEYDGLFDQLVNLETIQGWKDPDSPTIRISAAKGKIKHPHKLYSLKKAYSLDDIDPKFNIQLPKLDGVNLSITYLKKNINTVLTRGDGEYGESVSHLYKVIRGIPTSISDDVDYTFVGEVLTDNLEVENFRNYVAGALGLKSAKEAATRNLRFVVHDVLNCKKDFLTRMETASNLGFSTILSENYSKYPQDGIVYRLNSYAAEQELGYTNKYPRFAIALKKKEHYSAVTYLNDIEWTIGRSGVVTPVGLVEPVVLDGATVSRVILHNIEFVEHNSLRRGDMILIERRITPQFVRVVQHSSYEPFTIVDAKVAVGKDVYRKGPKLYVDAEDGYRLVEYYAKTLGIKGLGESSIKKLDIQHPSELYGRHDWEYLGKNGEKIQYELSRPKDYTTVLASLGIPGVGKSTAKLIVDKIPKFEDLRSIANVSIRGIGPATVEKILTWLEVNEDWVLGLPYELAHNSSYEQPNSIKKIAITGKLDMTKKDLADHLKPFGFQVIDTVSKDCYALITSGEESTKTRQAEKYNIPVYNYWNNKSIILKGMF